MYEELRFEWFIFKEVMRGTWNRIKIERSLEPIVDIFNPHSVFQIEGYKYRKGSYYKYIRGLYDGSY